MTVLVSGATGFVGGAITRHLLAAGHTVRAMSRSASGARQRFDGTPEGRAAIDEGRLSFVEADVTDPASLAAAVRDVTAVVQAAQFRGAPVEDPARGLTYMNVDRNGTLNLLGALASVYGRATAGPALARFPEGSPHFVYVSAIGVYEDPKETWNRAKWQAEQAIRGSGMDWTIVRNCWIYGADDSALNRILHYSDYLPFVPIFGDGTAALTPLFKEDMGDFFVRLLEDPARSKDTLFRLGGPDEVTLNGFLELALEIMGRKRPILHIPKPVGKVQGAIMQHFPGRPLSPDAVDFVAQAGAVAPEDRELVAERFPDFRTTTLRRGLCFLAPGDS